jgi:hypothetical protein
MTIGPALVIDVFYAGLDVVQICAMFEAVIHCVFRTGLEGAGCEARLAGGATERLD